jgi:hypothetical protein
METCKKATLYNVERHILQFIEKAKLKYLVKMLPFKRKIILSIRKYRN